jgi:hypothetical protein
MTPLLCGCELARGSIQSSELMDADVSNKLRPGAKVKVVQQIPARDRTWTKEVRGTVVGYEQRTTGSWYAHAKDDKLWLDRLKIQKPDGELTTLILDEYSHVEVEAEAPAAPAAT